MTTNFNLFDNGRGTSKVISRGDSIHEWRRNYNIIYLHLVHNIIHVKSSFILLFKKFSILHKDSGKSASD